MDVFFEMKEIPVKYRKFLIDYFDFDPHIINKNLSNKEVKNITEKIMNKNILILDDTVSSGETISIYSRNLMETFSPTPKSVTVLTLLSAKNTKNKIQLLNN
ncbi:MAG: hypothetical protein LBU83_06050 [Bacteroidales bacterium]|jgi:hypoxanthine-guanine phosphoribosyltransferase|nr:hypothetical protein [Bacteroidales bacterium]